MPKEHEIKFEDLHGAPDESTLMIDLDVEDKDKGITRVAKDDEDDKGKDRGKDKDDDRLDDEEQQARARTQRGEDESDEDYSRRVRKRIDRERRLRDREVNEANEERDYWKEQAEAAQRQLQDRSKRVSKEDLDKIGEDIKGVEKDLAAAIENGKTEDQVRLTSKLTDLKAKEITTRLEAESEEGSDKSKGRDRVREQGGPSRQAKLWMDKRSDWFGKPGFEKETRAANRIDREIYSEGYDVNDPEYFAELDKRLRNRYPDLYDDDGGDERGTARRRASDDRRSERSPVGEVPGDGGRRKPASSSRVELNAEDFDNMRKFGLDTNDPEVLKEYARNKREADNDQRQREGGRS
jgi:hypothetical protein